MGCLCSEDPGEILLPEEKGDRPEAPLVSAISTVAGCVTVLTIMLPPRPQPRNTEATRATVPPGGRRVACGIRVSVFFFFNLLIIIF